MEEVDIRVNNMGVGKVRLDLAEIKGEGGEHDPRLVIPIKIELYQQSREHQIFITRLSASLHLDQDTDHSKQFASRVSYDLIYNIPMRSVNQGSSNGGLELRFNLTHAQLKALENMRQQPGKYLYLRLEPVVAWNKHTGNSMEHREGKYVSTVGEDGWPPDVGLFSYLAFFLLPSIGTLSLDLAAMNWVEKIFPGVGYDHFRLVEVKLPILDDRLIPKDAIEHFKEALQDYDKRLYRECLSKCRLVHEAVEKEIQRRLSIREGRDYKVRDHKLGEAVALDLGWTSDSEQEKFLNGAWKPLYIMANAADHTPSVKSLLPADAHVVLISTAAMLEYLAQLG
jgi:hypothetical protein